MNPHSAPCAFGGVHSNEGASLDQDQRNRALEVNGRERSRGEGKVGGNGDIIEAENAIEGALGIDKVGAIGRGARTKHNTLEISVGLLSHIEDE